MLQLVLIVKGDKFQAARAAADRKIPLAFIREKNGETIAKTGEEHRSAVAAWFAEDTNRPKFELFPIGTLLHYSEC